MHEPVLAFQKFCTHLAKSMSLQILQKLVAKLAHKCGSTFQRTKIPMGSFQVCDAMSILFKLEKLDVEHLEGFILLPREGVKLQKN